MVKINENDIFGDYKIISRNYDKKAAATYWNCKCIKCGKERILRGDQVRKNQSCKCDDPLIGTESNEFLILLKTDIKSKDNCNVFKCQCKKCGNIEFIASNILRSKRKHCSSCYNKKTTLIDMTGQNYGYLTVLSRDMTKEHTGHENDAYWICKCNNCGSIKSIRGISLRKGYTTSCGCIKSKGEEYIAKILEENQIPFQREYSFCDLIYKSPLKFDFAIFSKNGTLSHLIEFDGKQHFEINNFFGGEEEFQKNKIRDELKNNYCIENKIPLIRIKYDEEINLERIMNYGTYECSTERA